MPKAIPVELVASHFWSKVDSSGGEDACWPWKAYIKPNGYGYLRPPGTRKSAYSHRTAYELSFGEIPDGMLVCHSCDNRKCCNPRHLWIGTFTDNAQDCIKKGRASPPPKNDFMPSLMSGDYHLQKFTPDVVLAIRREAESGRIQREIAAEFGVSQQHVSQIKNRKRWGSI